MDFVNTIKSDFNEIKKKYKVNKIGIFGSCARGDYDRDSDIDILVEFSEPVDLFHFIDLKEHLEALLKRKVDLVTPKALKPCLRERILEEVVNI